MKWKIPELKSLTQQHSAAGLCSNGSGDMQNCWNGTSANFDCAGGTAAIWGCYPGSGF